MFSPLLKGKGKNIIIKKQTNLSNNVKKLQESKQTNNVKEEVSKSIQS